MFLERISGASKRTNYFGAGEAIGKGKLTWRDTRPRTTLRNGTGLLGSSQAIIRQDAIIEHAGIARSVRFMVRHFHRPINVTDLMVVAGLSRRGFLKSFRKHTGRAPGAVLRLMRIEHAKRLLADHDLAPEEVAVASGFRKTNSFYVTFRNVTGFSPMNYQLQLRAKLNGQGQRMGTNGALQRCAPPRRATSRWDWNL